jgi:hypothetical protein
MTGALDRALGRKFGGGIAANGHHGLETRELGSLKCGKFPVLTNGQAAVV